MADIGMSGYLNRDHMIREKHGVTDMLERVEVAITQKLIDEIGFGVYEIDMAGVAREAIEAMREPTTQMVNASSKAETVLEAWGLMIDAALREPNKEEKNALDER